MKKHKIQLSDLSGGLNDRDHPSGIPQNEACVLENYYTDAKGTLLESRGGKELMQYAPIDPQIFVNDTNTQGLWHLDEGAAPFIDGSANGYDLNSEGSVTSAQALFPIGAGLGIKLTEFSTIGSDGSVLYRNTSTYILNAASEATFEAWVWIPTTFTGRQETISRGGQDRTCFIHSGACIVGTASSGLGKPLAFKDGITIHRDWDSTAGKDASDPYFKFTLYPEGLNGQATILQGLHVPMAKWLHVRGTYNAATAKMRLYVNGSLHAEATIQAPTALQNGGTYVTIGGAFQTAYGPTSNIYATFPGIIDEARISNVERTAVPYKEPRGKGFWLSKSDGTQQYIVAAGDGLFYTVGNAEWTRLRNVDGTDFVCSETAYWDAVQVKNILYLSNGTDAPKAWDGVTLLGWGNPDAPPVVTLGTGAGAVTSGDRLFAYTYLYGDYETGPSPTATIANPTGLPINMWSIKPRHSNCTGVRAYVSKAGGTDLYLYREISHDVSADMEITGPWAAGTPAGYETDTGGFGVADSALGTAVYPSMDAAVANSETKKWKYLLAEHSRIFGCGEDDEPYTLRWSELGAVDCFRAFSFTNADAKRGPLIALASFYGEIHASKNGEATLILRGDNPQNWVQLETLHPTIGCIDHWAYVHHYDINSDKYVLVFPARDGFYAYAGQAIQKISDKIDGTTDRLAQIVANRAAWLVTTQADYLSNLKLAGSASNNIQQAKYESDGIRAEPGKLKMIDQLDYLGLWSDGDPVVAGHPQIISVCKGDGEGVFFFGTAADNILYRTDDNFITAYAVETVSHDGSDTSERIIEIVREGTADAYHLLTDTAGTDYTIGSTTVCKSSGGGFLYSYVPGVGVALEDTTRFYYDLDVPVHTEAGVTGSTRQTGSGVYSNIYLNHPQSLRLYWSAYTTVSYNVSSCPNISGNATSVVAQGFGGNLVNDFKVACSAGFFSTGVVILPFGPTPDYLLSFFSRREYPKWRGGTFRPQAAWDDTQGKLFFLASTAEDSNGNRSTYLREFKAGVGLTTYSSNNVSAFAFDGTNVYWAKMVDSSRGTWFNTTTISKALATAPGTATYTYNHADASSIYRLFYDSTKNRICLFDKLFSGQQQYWAYGGRVWSLEIGTGNKVSIKTFSVNGDSGAYFSEYAYRTNTPNLWVIAAQGFDLSDSYPLYTLDPSMDAAGDLSTLKATAYLGLDAGGAATGIHSNLIFVESSGAAGNYNWADRIYFYSTADTSADQRMIQLGLKGDWEVRGEYIGPYASVFGASGFDSLDSDFQGNITFYLRNADDAADLSLAASEQLVQPNVKLGSTVFAPPKALAQWRTAFVWVYSLSTGSEPAVPYINFVELGYYLGAYALPRVVGIHYRARSYWAVAQDSTSSNNIVLVWQKTKTWTKLTGWRLKGMSLFRNELVGIEDYQLVRLESGTTDLGNLIPCKARTGYSMGYVDKLISGVQANVRAVVNNAFPDRGGYVILTPYRGDDALPGSRWVLPLPASTTREPRRVKGSPYARFGYDWARAWSLEIATSQDTSGSWVPFIGQSEVIQQIDLTLDVTGEAYDLPVE